MAESIENIRALIMKTTVSAHLDLKYYNTYYYANVIENILKAPFAYLRNLDGFWGDINCYCFIYPFSKFSAFHCFIEYVIDDLIIEFNSEWDLDKARENVHRFPEESSLMKQLPIEKAFHFHSIDHDSFEEWLISQGGDFSQASEDDIHDYLMDLRVTEPYEKLMLKMIEEVFFLMFLNRGTLTRFNQMLAFHISDIHINDNDLEDDDKKLFKRDGVLKRVTIPKWARKAVFYRDRGRCVLCNCDLSGLVSLLSAKNFDHIVPLADGGINDISNLQLLCSKCNQEKLDKYVKTSTRHEKWYQI